MGQAKGFLSLAGFKKATTWGTPVVVAAGDGIGFVSEDMSNDVQLIEDAQIEGVSSQQRQGEKGQRLFSGSITTESRYEGLEPIIAQVFGTAGVPATVDITARKHTLKLNNSLEGIFGTLAIQKSVPVVHEYTTAKVTGFTLTCEAGGRARVSFRIAPQDMNQNTSAGTNNNTTMGSVTLPANREFLQFRQMVVRSNAQAGAALGATDVLYVTGLTIDVERNLAIDQISTQYGDRIDEPIQDNWTVVGGSFTMPNFFDGTGGSAAAFADQLTKAARKCDIVFTGDNLAGSTTEKFAWRFYVNSLQFSEGTPNVSGPGRLGFTLNWRAFRVTTSPTGFPAGTTDAITLEIVSQRTTDPLA